MINQNQNQNSTTINETFSRADHFMAGRIATLILPKHLEVVRVEV